MNFFQQPAEYLRTFFRGLGFLSVCFLVLGASGLKAQPDARQTTLLINNCLQCHAKPESTAPILGVVEDWADARARGEDAVLHNVVEGVGGMPPLGYCSACSEQDFRVLIRMFLGTTAEEGKQQ